MHSLVRIVFSRLKAFEADEAENQLARDEDVEKARAEPVAINQAEEGPVSTVPIAGATTRPEVTVSSTPTPSPSPRE